MKFSQLEVDATFTNGIGNDCILKKVTEHHARAVALNPDPPIRTYPADWWVTPIDLPKKKSITLSMPDGFKVRNGMIFELLREGAIARFFVLRIKDTLMGQRLFQEKLGEVVFGYYTSFDYWVEFREEITKIYEGLSRGKHGVEYLEHIANGKKPKSKVIWSKE